MRTACATRTNVTMGNQQPQQHALQTTSLSASLAWPDFLFSVLLVLQTVLQVVLFSLGIWFGTTSYDNCTLLNSDMLVTCVPSGVAIIGYLTTVAILTCRGYAGCVLACPPPSSSSFMLTFLSCV